MSRSQVGLIKEAITAAESSISLAKRLLDQIDHEDNYHRRERSDRIDRSGERIDWHSNSRREKEQTISSSNPSEITGIFKDLEMITDRGQKYAVPRNYISKSMIVEGDRLKIVKENGADKFKQIQRVKRKRLVGPLIKKDGEFAVITEVGSYKVLPEAVAFLKAKENEKVTVLIPESIKGRWAALEGLTVASAEAIVDNLPEAEASLVSEKEKPEKKKRTVRAKKTIKEVKEVTPNSVEMPKVDKETTAVIKEPEKEITVVAPVVEPKTVFPKEEVDTEALQ